MAKAITAIRRLELSEEEQRRRDREEIEDLLIAHKDVLKDVLHMLEKIQGRSGLDVVTGLFDKGDEVLDVLVKATDKPEVAKIIKNGLLAAGALGKLNIEDMNPFINKLNSGLQRAVRSGNEEASYGPMLQMLAAPETKKAIMFLLAFLKGMGTDTPKSMAVQEEKQGKKGWMLAAGLSLAGAALLSKQWDKAESKHPKYDKGSHQQ